ncbi:PAS domain S-box protein [bacterium]|nr:PAS domain S-box protein [bacterium]
MNFLRNLIERRRQLKREKEDPPESSTLVKSVDELDRISAALKKSDDDLVAVSAALRKSEDALAARVLQRGVLSELGQRALRGTDLNRFLSETCYLISQILDVEFCSIVQATADNCLFLSATSGWPAKYSKGYQFQPAQATDIEFTLKKNEPVLFKNLKDEKRFVPPEYLLENWVNSGLNAVILGQGNSLGVLSAHTKKVRNFNHDEINFLQGVANMVGAAIQRKESETVSSQLASVIESSDNAIIGTSPEGTILSWNPSAGRIFGFSEEEAIRDSISIIVPDDKKEEHNNTLELLRKGETVGHFETVRIRKTGECIDVSITASPIKNQAGEVIGISMIARDITKEKQDADRLRKSETQLKAAQRIAQMGSWEWDLVSNCLHWSQELYRIYGVNPAEQISFEKFIELVHPDDRRLVQSFFESKRMFSIEHRIVRPDAETRYIQIRAEVVSDSEGAPISLMGIAQDVTDRKRADEQLRSSREQLRALSAHLQFIREEERSRIAREVHDELGQVLTALKMDLSLLNHKLLESSAILPRKMLYEEIKSMSKKVDITIKSVRKIVTELRPEVLDHLGLKSAIEWQAQEFQTRSGIDCKLDPHMESIEMNDRDGETAIFRILQEALTNIARHSGASKVEIFLNKDDGEITMEVRDNGRGISDADLSKSRSFGLLGMRERALFLGGDLEVKGNPGFGTSVKVQIPVRKSLS